MKRCSIIEDLDINTHHTSVKINAHPGTKRPMRVEDAFPGNGILFWDFKSSQNQFSLSFF